MDDEGFFVGLVIGLLVAFCVTGGVSKSYYHSRAIEDGVAHYDARTGEFVWNKETKDAATK